MTLTLSALSLNDQPLTQPVVARFDAKGGTIGRGEDNALALPDPERHISRQHARITSEEKGYRITNLSGANAVTVAGRTLGQGESAPVRHRDLVRIGGFLLEVRDDGSDDPSTRIAMPGRGGGDALSGGSRAPHEAPPPIAPAHPDDNPFGDLFGSVIVRQPAPDRSARPPARLDPFDFDAPKLPSESTVPPAFDNLVAPASATSDMKDPFSDFGSSGGTLDEMLGTGSVGAANALDSWINPAPVADIDHRVSTALDVSSAPGGGAALPDHALSIHAAFPAPSTPSRRDDRPAVPIQRGEPSPMMVPFRPVVAPEARAPALQAAVPPTQGVSGELDASTAALWQAFCEGADLRLPGQSLTPELMKVIGLTLRSAVDGTLQMVAIRAEAKGSFGAEVTQIRSTNNNPLRFSPDAQSALEQLLQPPRRGFMDGPEAMTEAMHDLIGHTIGTIAGMRSALEGVLNRFAPTAVEAKLSVGMLDAVLPMNRRARLWELYLQHFESIRGEAQEDFHALFGRAFMIAYDQQVDRLYSKNARGRSKGARSDGAKDSRSS